MTRKTYIYRQGHYWDRPIPIDFVKNHQPTTNNPWSSDGEEERIAFADGTPVRINHVIRDRRACECLLHLQVQVMDFGHRIVMDCDDIKFKCMSPNAQKTAKHKIQACLKRMRDGKCPYKIARQIFTNIPNKKSR